MGVAAGAAGAGAGSSAGAGAGAGAATTLLTATGLGAGGIFVAAALLFLLAYLNVLDASERNVARLRALTLAAVIPLFATFMAVVAFEAIAIL